jgi:malonyl CoA-acyl carrier protein transacylase
MNAANTIGHFGSHNGSAIADLRRLFHDKSNSSFFETVFDAIGDGLRYARQRGCDQHLEHGFALRNWLEGNAFPAAEYLQRSVISLPCTHIVQLCLIQRIRAQMPIEGRPNLVGMVGHSMGLQSAVAAAVNRAPCEFLELCRQSILFVFIGALRCQQVFETPHPSSRRLAQSHAMTNEPPTPMAAIRGTPLNFLKQALDTYNACSGQPAIEIALDNGCDFYVISGCTDDLIGFRFDNLSYFPQGTGRWSYLKSTLPFHSSILKSASSLMSSDRDFIGLNIAGKDLAVPVFATDRLFNLQLCDDLYMELYAQMTYRNLFWGTTVVNAVLTLSAQRILDFGASMTTSFLTRQNLRRAKYSIQFDAVPY